MTDGESDTERPQIDESIFDDDSPKEIRLSGESNTKRSQTVHIVIGHTRWHEDGFELLGVYDDPERAESEADDPDGRWPSAYVTEEEVL